MRPLPLPAPVEAGAMVAWLWPRAEVFVPGRPAVAATRHTLPATVRPHAHDFLELALVLDGEAVQRS
jgi:hypothetical protein